MSEYKKYFKIHRLGKEETDGILDYELTVQEKIDGANCSIFWHEGEVRCGTKNRMLPKDEEGNFKLLIEYVNANDKLEPFLRENQNLVLYGEWLVRHTITYPDEAYRQVYLFDVYDREADTWARQETVREVADALGFQYPHIFAEGKLTQAEIEEFVGKSNIAPAGEGVVLKADGFVNKFGDTVYAKVVHQKFKESNAIVFGGNNKHSDTYWEMYVVNKYCTVARVQKIMQKLQAEVPERLDMQHTPRVTQTCFHDIVTEEMWEIVNKAPALDFKKLKTLCSKKNAQIYHDILNNRLSVADSQGA